MNRSEGKANTNYTIHYVREIFNHLSSALHCTFFYIWRYLSILIFRFICKMRKPLGGNCLHFYPKKMTEREREREIVLYIVIFLSLSLFCTLRVCVCMYVFILGPLLQVKTIYFRMFIAQRALKTHSLSCSLCV